VASLSSPVQAALPPSVVRVRVEAVFQNKNISKCIALISAHILVKNAPCEMQPVWKSFLSK